MKNVFLIREVGLWRIVEGAKEALFWESLSHFCNLQGADREYWTGLQIGRDVVMCTWWLLRAFEITVWLGNYGFSGSFRACMVEFWSERLGNCVGAWRLCWLGDEFFRVSGLEIGRAGGGLVALVLTLGKYRSDSRGKHEQPRWDIAATLPGQHFMRAVMNVKKSCRSRNVHFNNFR